MNVQQIIIKGIKDQLFSHNYLVLPEFGGFILKSNPSHFSNSGNLLLPPCKTLSFNSQLKQNDGILATWLQQNLNCTSSEALSALIDFSEYCKSVLITRRRLTLNGLGFFYLDFENNTCFEPQLDTNFLIDSFGLTPISLIEISNDEIKKNVDDQEFIDRVLNDRNNHIHVVNKKKYKQLILPSLILVTIFSLLALVITNTKITGNLKATIFGTSNNVIYTPLVYSKLNLTNTIKENTQYITDASGIASIELGNNKLLAVKVLDDVNIKESDFTSTVEVKSKKHYPDNFEVVLGCFSVFENAQRMIEKLNKQKISAFISDKNEKGMFVVCNGDFETKEQAVEILTGIKEKCPNAWVKKSN